MMTTNNQLALKYELNVTFHVRAPIMVKATSKTEYGIDVMFHRDFMDRICIPSSHIKGKLREAMKELNTSSKSFIEKLFGKGADENDPGPHRGLLEISNFYPLEKTLDNEYAHRISIDPTFKTTKETALLSIEMPFPRGMTVKFNGKISFYALDEAKADEICNALKPALRWITGFGGFKTVGFGAVQSVDIELKKCELKRCEVNDNVPNNSPTENNQTRYLLRIEAEEPLLLGGTRKKGNYLESEEIISGAVIKGSLAADINRVTDPDSLNKEVVSGNHEFAKLKENFSKIRFTHAFPTYKEKPRPIVIPYSIAEVNGCYLNILTFDNKDYEKDVIKRGVLKFQVDWKDDSYIKKRFGWVSPRRFFYSRTAIEGDFRSAKENSLYTYQYVCPHDSNKAPILWLGEVMLDGVDENERNAVLKDLFEFVHSHFRRLGKGCSKIKAYLEPLPAHKCHQPPQLDENTKEVLIALQSDALMINPDDMIMEHSGDELKKLYNKYWNEVSGGSLKLVDFFAAQVMKGGYLLKRFQGNKKYYPFYLTKAGSIFKLKIKDKAKNKMYEWYNKGLPIPDWAKEKYEANGDKAWDKCPFVPENGFGEVLITNVCFYNKYL